MPNLNINLLPEHLVGGGKTAKLKNSLNTFLAAAVGIFVVGALGAAIALLIFSLQLQDLQKTRVATEETVKNLQDTEQKLFFIQDRLTKVKSIRSGDALAKSVASFNSLLASLPASATIAEADVTNVSISLVVELVDARDVASFLSQSIAQDFKRVNLEEFNYSPESGYALTLIYFPK